MLHPSCICIVCTLRHSCGDQVWSCRATYDAKLKKKGVYDSVWYKITEVNPPSLPQRETGDCRVVCLSHWSFIRLKFRQDCVHANWNMICWLMLLRVCVTVRGSGPAIAFIITLFSLSPALLSVVPRCYNYTDFCLQSRNMRRSGSVLADNKTLTL